MNEASYLIPQDTTTITTTTTTTTFCALNFVTIELVYYSMSIDYSFHGVTITIDMIKHNIFTPPHTHTTSKQQRMYFIKHLFVVVVHILKLSVI